MSSWDQIIEKIGLGGPPPPLPGWHLLGGEPGGATRNDDIWFVVVPPVDRSAISVLRELAKDPSAFVRFVALKYLHTAGADDLSLLTDALLDPDRDVRLLAAVTLVDCGRAAESRPVVPILIDGLKHNSSWAQYRSVQALAGLGRAAKPAVSELIELDKRWKDIKLADGRDATNLAADALRRIDPEASAKAGFK
jgi:hypothetical protein